VAVVTTVSPVTVKAEVAVNQASSSVVGRFDVIGKKSSKVPTRSTKA